MSIRRKILLEVEAVAAEHKRTLAPLHDDLLLKESGLDSLCFAVVVVNLADKLGYNPFGVSDDTAIPATIGELVELYERHSPALAEAEQSWSFHAFRDSDRDRRVPRRGSVPPALNRPAR